jgi:hypothetical protein
MLKVTNPSGIKFNVRFVKPGDNYGLNRALINSEKITLVEFYDAAYEGFGEDGQFISRYHLDTIMECHGGIQLEGSIRDWYVSADNVFYVQLYIEQHKL